MTPEGHAGASARSAPPTLLASCPGCGDVVIQVGQARVLTGTSAGDGRYEFGCPQCRCRVLVPASGHLLRLLACLGADVPPARPALPAVAGVLTLRDLHQLRAALATTQDVAARAALS